MQANEGSCAHVLHAHVYTCANVGKHLRVPVCKVCMHAFARANGCMRAYVWERSLELCVECQCVSPAHLNRWRQASAALALTALLWSSLGARRRPWRCRASRPAPRCRPWTPAPARRLGRTPKSARTRWPHPERTPGQVRPTEERVTWKRTWRMELGVACVCWPPHSQTRTPGWLSARARCFTALRTSLYS